MRRSPSPRTPPAKPSPNGVLERLGAEVRAIRTQRGESRAAVAARSGVSVRFLAQLEAGEANISLLRLTEVAEALEVGLAELLGLNGHAEARPSRGPVGEVQGLLARRTSKELVEVRDWLTTRFGGGPRIALLGLRGAGKSTVGRQLARTLRLPFFELDVLIEQRAGLSLAQIFELQGEPAYRRLERETLAEFLRKTPAGVLATGGGLVTDPETWALLRRHCTTVWLRAAPEQHWRRVVRQGDRRPMRDNPSAMQELRTLLTSRAPLYAQAHRTVETTRRSVAQVAADVAAGLGTPVAPRRSSG